MVESRGTRSVCGKFSKGTVLKSAGIVDDERKQRMVEYSLVTPCVVDFAGLRRESHPRARNISWNTVEKTFRRKSS